MEGEGEECLVWLAFAEEDYEFALMGMERFPRLASWQFHQAAEKFL